MNGMNPGYCVLVTVWLAKLGSVILSPFTKVATITSKASHPTSLIKANVACVSNLSIKVGRLLQSNH